MRFLFKAGETAKRAFTNPNQAKTAFDQAVRVFRSHVLQATKPQAPKLSVKESVRFEPPVSPQVSRTTKVKSHFKLPILKGNYLPKPFLNPNGYTTKFISTISSISSSNSFTSPSSNQRFWTWLTGAVTITASGITTYLTGQSAEDTPQVENNDPLYLGGGGYDADTYKALRKTDCPECTFSKAEKDQFEALERALEDVVHTGNMSFYIKEVIGDTEFLEPLTRHDDPASFNTLRYNIDNFRAYVTDYKRLINSQNIAFQKHAMLSLIDKCARNGCSSFLQVLANEFDAQELIGEHSLANRLYQHPARHVLEDILRQQRVYYIEPKTAQANILLFLKMMRQQALAQVSSNAEEEKIIDNLADAFIDSDSGVYNALRYVFKQLAVTREVNDKFKYIAVIDADKPETQFDLYLETLKRESRKHDKPITGICMFGAAHFTVAMITVDAGKKQVNYFYNDSFGGQKGTEPDTTLYPSLHRIFIENPESPYNIDSMISKFTTQRGNSMGCSVHACMNLGILMEIGEWLGNRYPQLRVLPVEQRLYTYCRELDQDGPIETRISHRTTEEIARGDFEHWHIAQRYTRFVRPPMPFLIMSQSVWGRKTVNAEVIQFFTDVPNQWNWTQDPIEIKKDVIEQHGVKAQLQYLREENSPMQVELEAPFPHLGYHHLNFEQLLDRFITQHSNGSERSEAIHVFVQDMREAMVNYFLKASPLELWQLSKGLDDPQALFSAAAMAKRLHQPTTIKSQPLQEACESLLMALQI